MEVATDSGDKGFSVPSIPVFCRTLFPEDVEKACHSQMHLGNHISEFIEHINILQALMVSHLINYLSLFNSAFPKLI